MESETKVYAEDGKQELQITRTFDLPVESLFDAYVDPEIIAHWMGTKVLKIENRRFGCYHFETTDPTGGKHSFSGVIHEFEAPKKITRTFEMENTHFPVQLEFLDFKKLTEASSQLDILIIFKSVADRDNLLKLPFAMGLNMAHNKLQEYMHKMNM